MYCCMVAGECLLHVLSDSVVTSQLYTCTYKLVYMYVLHGGRGVNVHSIMLHLNHVLSDSVVSYTLTCTCIYMYMYMLVVCGCV